MGEEEGPALENGPSLRDGVEAVQGGADLEDGLCEKVAVFVLQTDFYLKT